MCGFYKKANDQCHLFSLFSVVELEQSETKMKFLTVFTILSIAAVAPIRAIPGLFGLPSNSKLTMPDYLRNRLPKLPSVTNFAKIPGQVQSVTTEGLDTIKNGATDLTSNVSSMANGVTENITDAVNSGMTTIGISTVIVFVRQYISKAVSVGQSYVAHIQSLLSRAMSYVGISA